MWKLNCSLISVLANTRSRWKCTITEPIDGLSKQRLFAKNGGAVVVKPSSQLFVCASVWCPPPPLSAHSARTHSCVIKRKLKTERGCVGCCVVGLAHLAVMSQKQPGHHRSWWNRKDLLGEGLHGLPRFCGVLPASSVQVRTIFWVGAISTGG